MVASRIPSSRYVKHPPTDVIENLYVSLELVYFLFHFQIYFIANANVALALLVGFLKFFSQQVKPTMIQLAPLGLVLKLQNYFYINKGNRRKFKIETVEV